MAVIANTYNTYETVGIPEDLTDVIYNISPEETVFLSNAGKGKMKQTFHEWQIDELAAAVSTNAVVEGDDVTTFTAITPTTRIGNRAQIARKDAIVSDTNEAVDKKGRDSEMAYQKALKSAEIKRDMEKGLLDNQAAVAGATATARKTAGLLAFIKTNVDKEGTGTNPVYTTIPDDPRNDGATRAFTEAMLQNVVELQWNEGGKCDTLMVGGAQKSVVSAFAGIATKTFYQSAAKAAAIIGAADVYVSEFGNLSIVPNRLQRSRDAFLLNFDLIDVLYLRPFKWTKLAKTGDAEKQMLTVEYGLKVKNEAGLGLIADLA